MPRQEAKSASRTDRGRSRSNVLPHGKSAAATGEEQLIARYFKPLARAPGALALADDAAFLTPPAGHDLVLTVDAVVAGVHFFEDDPADAVARKALRVNLSDLAAKGARPAGFLLTLAMPAQMRPDWLKAFARGLGADARRYRCPLLGGDSVSTPGPLMVSVTAFGTVPKGRMVQRKGARAGDIVFVTGTIGDAALGVTLRKHPRLARRWRLDDAMRAHLADRYLLPQPRNSLADAVRRYAGAAMDVSDGLAGDLAKLCRTSGVGAELDAAAVPLSDAARAALAADPALIATVLGGGDDFEIVGAVAPPRFASLRRAGRAAGIAVTAIGRFAQKRGLRIAGTDGRRLELSQRAYSHF